MNRNNAKLIRLFSYLLETIDISREDAKEYVQEMIDTANLFEKEENSNLNPNYKILNIDNELYLIQGLLGEIAAQLLIRNKPGKRTIQRLVLKLEKIKKIL